MGVPEGRGQLAEALKQLKRQWNDTRSHWDDAISQEFEETYLTPLDHDARSVMGSMDHMAALLSRVRQDCR